MRYQEKSADSRRPLGYGISMRRIVTTSMKDRWSPSNAFQLAALGVVIAAVIISVPLGVYLGIDGRYTRSRMSQHVSRSPVDLHLKDTATDHKIRYPTPTVQPATEFASPLLFQGFEWYIPKDGKHWSRLSAALPRLYEIGVGAIWIPPPTKAATQGSIGYNVYDLWDLGEFDNHNRTSTAMGSKADLLSLSQEAHKWGIGLVIDAVLNQRSGADFTQPCAVTLLDPSNRLQPINPTKVTEVWVGFNFTARGNKYSNKTWSCNDFTAVDYDAGSDTSGLFKINGVDDDFATDVSSENGNYDYLTLIDVAYENPSVREDVLLWGPWVAGQLGASGFRIDAAKHISRGFLKDWIANVTPAIQNSFQSPPFVAEYWTTTLDELLVYVRDMENASRVFDVPLLGQFAALGNGEASLLTMFENSVVSSQPNSAVTLVGNHDTELGQTSDSLYVQNWFQASAYSFILLRQEGVPCIFYGHLFGVCDESGQCSPSNNSETISKLAIARTHFAYGKQQDYNSTDISSVGWVRMGDSNHEDGLAVTMSNGDGESEPVSMDVGQQHAGEIWVDILSNATGFINIDTDGIGNFPVPFRDVSVFVKQKSWNKVALTDWNFHIYS